MFNKSYVERDVVYESKKLPLPDLIRDEQLKEILVSLGYKVVNEKSELDGRITDMDFLMYTENDTLRARNRGYKTKIEVSSTMHSPSHWKMTIFGNRKKEQELQKIADALETKTYQEALRLSESAPAWKNLPGDYLRIIIEERTSKK